MGNFLNAIRRQITEFIKRTSRKQKILLGTGLAAAVTVIAVLALALGREEYEVLYTGLAEAEAGTVMKKLEELGVDARARGTGTILVPADRADELRMDLAAEGYPQSGLNYDIFAGSTALGTTDLQTQTYLQYQLQENLRATILKLERINDCVVLVNMPKESPFVLSSDERPATASVMVEVKGGGKLTDGEVRAISNLVLKSVSGLELENISIVDTAMNQYDVTGEKENDYTTAQYELTQKTKETYEQQVLSVLTPVFGKENVSAAVNVVLNFDSETVTAVEYNTPRENSEQGLAVSMEELYELTRGEGGAEGTAGTDSNGVALPEYMYRDADMEDFQKISRTVNYELNELQTQIVRQQGSIEKISVAVLLNSRINAEDYRSSVVSLVSKAVGVDEDAVSVEILPFLETADGDESTGVFTEHATLVDGLKKKELVKTLIIAATVLVLAVFILRFLQVMLLRGRGGV
ncbi:MAG: flagellar M-ring protein FliF, partial [Clostridiales bacterium]|nr:flagellar M-ring protein FliF [Clostridiales bacterium]